MNHWLAVISQRYSHQKLEIFGSFHFSLVFVLLKSTWPHRSLSLWPWHTWYKKWHSLTRVQAECCCMLAHLGVCTAMCVCSVCTLHPLNAGYIHISIDCNCQARKSNTHPHSYVQLKFWCVKMLKPLCPPFGFQHHMCCLTNQCVCSLASYLGS